MERYKNFKGIGIMVAFTITTHAWNREISEQEQQEGSMHGLYSSGPYLMGRGPSQQQTPVLHQESPLIPEAKGVGTNNPFSTQQPQGKPDNASTITSEPLSPAQTNHELMLSNQQYITPPTREPIVTPPQAAPRTSGDDDLQKAIRRSMEPR